MKDRSIKILLLIVCLFFIFSLGTLSYSSDGLAADNDTEETDENGNKKKKKLEKIDDDTEFKLDKEVQQWLDDGGSIPGEAKYCTYSGSSHLWVLDDTDLSDGKIKIIGDSREGAVYIAGNRLTTFLKTQFFYGENLGEEENRIKFKRPRKDIEF